MTPLALMFCAVGLAMAAPDGSEAPAEASESAPSAADAPAEGDLRYEAVLRAEYLAGQPVLVPVRVWNAGSTVVEAPDIERRPWLVAFTFDQGKGELERRRTTPPASDAGRTVKLSPRSQRRTLLEVPASSALKPAEYRLQVTLDPDTLPKVLATDTIRLASPHPASADMVRSISAASRATDTTVWLHKAAEGFDLYLSPLTSNKGRIPAQWLAHLDTAVNPLLSEASGGEGGARHVVWAHGKRGFGWVALEGMGVALTSRLVELPWPEVELVGRPATDTTGNLHVPVWIPAPKGSGGEVRVVTVLDRGAVSYRRAATFQSRPVSIATTVDDAGAVQLLVGTSAAVDLYTVRQSGAAHAELPVPGRRVARAVEGSRYVDVRFGLRSSTSEQKGGLSILATSSSDAGLQSTWLGLRGAVLASAAPMEVPDGATLADVLPGHKAPGYLFKTGARQALYAEEGLRIPLEDSLHGDWTLARDPNGAPTLIRTANQTIFAVKPLAPRN